MHEARAQLGSLADRSASRIAVPSETGVTTTRHSPTTAHLEARIGSIPPLRPASEGAVVRNAQLSSPAPRAANPAIIHNSTAATTHAPPIVTTLAIVSLVRRGPTSSRRPTRIRVLCEPFQRTSNPPVFGGRAANMCGSPALVSSSRVFGGGLPTSYQATRGVLFASSKSSPRRSSVTSSASNRSATPRSARPWLWPRARRRA